MNRYLVTANHLNLRKDPSLTGKMCGSLQQGEVVECFKISGDDYWLKVKNQQGMQGWATHKHLVSLAQDDNNQHQHVEQHTFPWMQVAIREFGIKKYSGYSNNPRIVEYLSSVTLGLTHPVKDDIYWSSAFVNWCVEKSGCDGTDSIWSLAWHNWGKATTNPAPGCIAVFKRNQAGHVGFFIEASDTKIKILGANKLNEVCYQYIDKSYLLSYRIPFSVD